MAVDSSTPISDVVSNVLAESLAAGEIDGNVALGEESLAAVFEVSRTPVREALMRLANDGHLQRDARGRLRVAPLTSERILQVYTVWVALEGLCARASAMAGPATLPMELARHNDTMRACAQSADFLGAAAANMEFHDAIATASRNDMLIEFMKMIHAWVRRIPTTTLSVAGRAEQAFTQHGRLIDAIRTRDADLAEEIALGHMRDAERLRLDMLGG